MSEKSEENVNAVAEKIMRGWDWPEGVEEAFTPNGAELLPQVKDLLASSPDEEEEKEEDEKESAFSLPAWEEWEPVRTALLNLTEVRSHTPFKPRDAAHEFVDAWAKWIKLHGLPIPTIPSGFLWTDCYTDEEPIAYKQLNRWVEVLRWAVEAARDLKDIPRNQVFKALSTTATNAANACQVWLMMSGVIPTDWTWIDSQEATLAAIPAVPKAPLTETKPAQKETMPPVSWWVVEQLGDKFPCGDAAVVSVMDELWTQLVVARELVIMGKVVNFRERLVSFMGGLTLWLVPCGLSHPRSLVFIPGNADFRKPSDLEDERAAFSDFQSRFNRFNRELPIANELWAKNLMARVRKGYPEMAAAFNTWLSYYSYAGAPSPAVQAKKTETIPAPRNMVDTDIEADLWRKQTPGSTPQQRLALVHAYRQDIEENAQKEKAQEKKEVEKPEKAGADLPSAPLEEESSDDWVPVAELRAAQLRDEEGLPPLHTPVIEMEGQDPDDLAPAREDTRAFFFDDETPTHKILFPELFPELPTPAPLETPSDVTPEAPAPVRDEPLFETPSEAAPRFGDGVRQIYRIGIGRGFVISTFSLILLGLMMSGCAAVVKVQAPVSLSPVGGGCREPNCTSRRW